MKPRRFDNDTMVSRAATDGPGSSADVVGLLLRPEVYEDSEEGREKFKGQAELVIAKNHSGAIGDVSLSFLSEYTRFEDVAHVGSDDSPAAEREAK